MIRFHMTKNFVDVNIYSDFANDSEVLHTPYRSAAVSMLTIFKR